MRQAMLPSVVVFGVVFGVVFTPAVHAAQVYGTLSDGGAPASGQTVTLSCSGQQKSVTTGKTGEFRIKLAPSGECTFTVSSLPGKPSVTVFLYDKPTRFDINVRRNADGHLSLQRR